MSENRSFPWWGVALGVGCLCILCVGILVIGGAAYLYLQPKSVSPVPLAPDISVTVPAGPTRLPLESGTASPVTPEPNAPDSSLTGDQQLNDHYLFDDFSSDALGWPVFDDGKTIIKYENGQYSFQIAEKEYYDWAYVPVDFSPTDISYDVWAENASSGTVGVFCQFQDADNYYYVEFDLADGSYVIGEVVAGDYIGLTPEDSNGQHWQDAANFASASGAFNRIGISCYQDFVTLFVNGEWETEVSVQQPFDTPGDMALFVYAYPFAGDEGIKAYFDNVEVFRPVQ